MKRLFLLFLAVSTGLSATLLDKFHQTLGLGYNSDIPTHVDDPKPSSLVQYSKTLRDMQQDTNGIISDETVVNFCAKMNIPSSTVEHIKHIISNCKNNTQFIEYLKTLNNDELLNLINAINYLNITINSVADLNKLLRYSYAQRTEVFERLSHDLKDYFYENLCTDARFFLKQGYEYKSNHTLNHTDTICSPEFSSNNKLVITVSADHTARIWDAATGQCLQTLQHNNSVSDAQFSSDNKLIVTASADSTAKIWDATTGQYLQTLKHNDYVHSAHFSSDNKLIVTASRDNTAKIWDAATGQCLQTLQDNGPVYSAQFSSDNKLVITASSDCAAKIWDAATGQCLQTLKHNDYVHSAQFSSDNKLVVTASADSTAKIWDATTGQCLQTLKHNWIRDPQFSSNNRFIVSKSGCGVLEVWTITKSEPIAKSTYALTPILIGGTAIAAATLLGYYL